jgi:peroxiredoxin (alkyl hydroperoxide reductase subunit C)
MNVLVGRKAPDFTAKAVLPNGDIEEAFSLSKTLRGKYGLVFFYPLDFTFVCPSELIALNNRLAEFKKRGVEVMTVSIDSHFTHKAWREKPVKDGGIGTVGFTMIADINHSICQSYGVEHPEAGVAFRGTFLIDQNGVVRSQIVNDLPLGRNIDEFIRLIDALQYHEEHGEVCPAGWLPGQAGMQATSTGVASYLAEYADRL